MSGIAGLTRDSERRSLRRRWGYRVLVLGGAVSLTLLFFCVLPLMQAIGKAPGRGNLLAQVDAAYIPPPPPPPPEQEEDEPEPEEKPPELEEDVQPLDLSQLEMALNAGVGEGWMSGDFALQLDTVNKTGGGDDLFSLAELDQKPRPIYQANPVLSTQARKRAPGTVWLVCVVDKDGRVQNPIVQESTDPAFERPALSAFKKWKYEPGKKNGVPVRFRIRQRITFPAQGGA